MLKIYTFIVLILLITCLSKQEAVEKGILYIQPSALESLQRYFDTIIILFKNGNQTQLQNRFVEQILKINETYHSKQLLFGIVDLNQDVNNILSRFSPLVHILRKRISYPYNSQNLDNLYSFYQRTVFPELPKHQDTANLISGVNYILFHYTNQTDFTQFQNLYWKIKEELDQFKLTPVAFFNNTKQISIKTSNNRIVKYESDLDDIPNLIQFINLQTIDDVTTLTQSNFYRVFASNKQVILILNESIQSQQQINLLKKQFYEAAVYNKYEELKYERMIFAISDMKFSENYFGDLIEDLSNSKYKILITRTDFQAFQLERYLYNQDTFTKDSIIEFLENFRMKRLKPYYRSEKRPTEQSGPLFKIVGKTFEEDVYTSKESVLVLFIDSKDPESYQKWQQQIISFQNTFNQFLTDKLVIGKFDLALNEHETLHLDYAPQLVLFERTNKKKARSFRGEMSSQNIKDWVNYWVKDLQIPDNFGKQTLALDL